MSFGVPVIDTSPTRARAVGVKPGAIVSLFERVESHATTSLPRERNTSWVPPGAIRPLHVMEEGWLGSEMEVINRAPVPLAERRWSP